MEEWMDRGMDKGSVCEQQTLKCDRRIWLVGIGSLHCNNFPNFCLCLKIFIVKY